MIVVTIFLLNNLPISASAGLVFADNSQASYLFGNIYEVGMDLLPSQFNWVYFGVTTDILYKKSNPFASEYQQNPNLFLRLVSFGAGPAVRVRFNKTVGMGMHFRLNNLGITYPESGTSSKVNYKTVCHWLWSYEIFGDFSFLSFKNINVGIETGLHYTRYGRDYYYYLEPEPFDYFVISGIYLKIILARW